MLCLRLSILALLMMSYRVFAHEVLTKTEGDLTISWEMSSSDTSANQIEILDDQGHDIVKLKVLKPVPDAKEVAIYDVSARGNLVAVAAVYVNKQGPRKVRNVGALLLFDLSGKLLSAMALDTTHAIAKLAVDDSSNVWTLTDGAGRRVDPAKVPVIVEYSSKGVIQRELLTRNLFPFHAYDTREDGDIGAAAMGYDAGTVWFWLPGSTDLVTISTSNYEVSRAKPGLPPAIGYSTPLVIKREPSGSLIAQISEEGPQGRVRADYVWSAGKGWSRFKPGNCDGQILVGTNEQGRLYLPFQSVHTSTCVFRNAR